MTCCLSMKKAARLTCLAAAAVLGLVWLSGCDNNYSADLRYGFRDDPLIDDSGGSLAGKDPGDIHLDVPGEYDRPGQPLAWLLPNLKPDELQRIYYPSSLNADQRQGIEQALEEMFGTPRSPKVAGFEDDEQVRKACRLEEDVLAEGSRLYRLHCLHCHGLTGNGRGPTAAWVNPHPRDYRQGKFKFVSVKSIEETGKGGRKARRADLLRTIREGIDGTSMPSFGLLSETEMEDIVSYVIHLSLRGESEYRAILKVKEDSKITGADLAKLLKATKDDDGITASIAPLWTAAQNPDYQIMPDATPVSPTEKEAFRKSVENGKRLFTTGAASCISCHIDYGRQAAYFYDAWGNVGRPLDLTLGTYRGGRRPIDLYYRINGGVPPSNMPAVGKQTKDDIGLTSKETWDVVNFLRVLPYPVQRKEFGVTIEE